MGTSDGEDDERPSHEVSLAPFAISLHPVTNAQYEEFVSAAGYPPPAMRDLPRVVTPEQRIEFRALAARHAWRDGAPPDGREHHPVTLVEHGDAVAYCEWLSTRIGHLVRLPTEAEWEYAARGGLDGRRYPWGDDIDPSRANYLCRDGEDAAADTCAVASYEPNGYGLFEMAGNVWEWVHDWYRADAYRDADRRNPRGPAHGRLRVVRGGSWRSPAFQLRCAYRHKVPPDTYAYSIGFRVAYASGSQ